MSSVWRVRREKVAFIQMDDDTSITNLAAQSFHLFFLLLDLFFLLSLSSHSLQHSVHCFKIKRKRVECQYILPRLVFISFLHFHSFNCDLMKKGESKVVTQMSSSSHQKLSSSLFQLYLAFRECH